MRNASRMMRFRSLRLSMPALALLLGALPLLQNASAMTMGEQSFTCPIGGETFTQRMATSGYQYGMQLDIKPVGAIAAPLPLPECPGNGFLIFDEGLSDADIDRLTAVVASREYQAMRGRESTYYRAAHLQRALGQPVHRIAWTLLRASWQAGGDQYLRYAEEALAEYRKALQGPPDGEFTTELQDSAHIVIGELLRRLGRFDEAQAHLRALQERKDWQDTPLAAIVQQELRLIAARNPLPAMAGEEQTDDGLPPMPPPTPHPPMF